MTDDTAKPDPELTEEQKRIRESVMRALADPKKIDKLIKALGEEPIPWDESEVTR